MTKQKHSFTPNLFALLATCLIVFLLSSCAKRPFVPVNEGREYGNPKTPWIVSHMQEGNQWALARTKHHNVFQKIICFHYPCRKMIGRKKVLKAISMKKFKKRIKKNAKKGAYKNIRLPVPVKKTTTNDTLALPSDTVQAVESIGLPALAPSILQADSLITLSEFLFEVNSYKLSSEHLTELDLLSKFLQDNPTLEVRIFGHTDDTGSEHQNVSLSIRRAESVAQYLVNKGVVYDNVFFEGLGSSQPIVGNETKEGRSKNRRVEILIRDPKEK